MTWRTHSKGRLYDANESTVVYFDSYSGDTHLLTDFAGFVVQQLEPRPLTTEELMHRVADSVDPDDIADLAAALTGVLEELVALDILTRD
ncbi:MAG: HPr-rel-A system PqqD family peptide chaperone [Halioglobus sp.]|nr:HPr-rel-A system PqqD family peptide chaperone [Halioglobus sp.]